MYLPINLLRKQYLQDSRRMIMNLQKPEAGSYCLKIDYFCDGINGESIREHCEPQYYDINVY